MPGRIWFDPHLQLHLLPPMAKGTLATHLGMEWEALGDNYLEMSMPVDERTLQPYGLLHGGASCALAETVGSIGSHLVLDPQKFLCVGMEINANHVRSCRTGRVIAKAIPLHLGRSSHVWDIKISDNDGKLVCISRLTVAITARS